MQEIIIGLISGIVGGLGMGGGTILILLLTIFSNVEQHLAQGTNVVFFIPTAIVAIIIFIKNKNIRFKIGLPICLWGLIGAYIGATIASNLEVGILRKCFGVFLILIALYQSYSLYKRYRKEKNRNTSIKWKKEDKYEYEIC